MKNKKGFSLLELMMVLAVASSISFMKFQDLKKDQENMVADAVGQQIKQVGSAVNGYINIHYDKLSTLTSVSTATGTDPGPRTCSTANNTCTITYQTLVNDGLLPSSFNGINANKSSYTIVLKRQGTSPNFIINGLVTTDSAWSEGSSIRYDLLGKAMQAAGVDSGMSKTTTSVSGYSGSWTEQSSDYSSINKTGILGYRVGYDSAMYSVFLRRDGTLPMTGDLDMGTNNIKNAKNITASGTGSFGGSVFANGKTTSDMNSMFNAEGAIVGKNIQGTGTVSVGTATTLKAYMNSNGDVYASNDVTALGTIYTKDSSNNIKSYINSSGTVYAGAEVVAHNGYGDTISIGGDASGGASADYEIRLGSNKTLTVFSPNSTQYSTVLNVNRNMVVNERLSTNGLDPNDLPSGWSGGIRTYDIFASGTIAAGTSKQYKAYISPTGNIYSSASIQGSYINSQGNIDASGNISGNGIYGNYVQSNGSMVSNGRLTTNEFLQINGVAGEGGGCSPNGVVGRTSAGKLLSCTNGVWTAAAVGTPGYYCRLTTFDGGRSDDYVGYSPRTDRSCPVIYPGQSPNGTCSCIKIILNY